MFSLGHLIHFLQKQLDQVRNSGFLFTNKIVNNNFEKGPTRDIINGCMYGSLVTTFLIMSIFTKWEKRKLRLASVPFSKVENVPKKPGIQIKIYIHEAFFSHNVK